MSPGRLIAVVGPSGVGKDSVMAGLHERLPELHLVRRVITRAPDLGGEVYDAVLVPEFEAMVENGAFAVYWSAHGLRYGIPVSVRYQLTKGRDCLVNFSRKALLEGAAAFPRFVVLNITATPQTVAQRLAARGRESADEIAKRLAEAEKPLPNELDVIHLSNDGPLDQTITRGASLLLPADLSL